jgi:hypothetical protein
LRVLGEFVSESFEFELSFAFPWFIAFCAICDFCGVFILLDDLLESFFAFWSSSCASYSLEFEIQTLCLCVVNVLIRGEIEKPIG